MINYGYIDRFYPFSLDEDFDYEKILTQIYKDKSCIIQLSGQNGENTEYTLKETFEDYIEEVNQHFMTSEEIDLSEVAVDIEMNNSCMRIYVSEELKGLKKIINESVERFNFINRKTVENIKKETSTICRYIPFQPIIFKYKDKIYHIDVFITFYSVGVGIINYTIPLRDFKFEKLTTFDEIIDLKKIQIPTYVMNTNSDSIMYTEASQKTEIEDIIQKYNEYIKNIVSKKSKIDEVFTNYTLIEYDGIKDKFSNYKQEVWTKLFWIVNKPFSHLNERDDSEYNEFKNGSYNLSKYVKFFVGSFGRSIIIWNNGYKSINNDVIKNISNDKKYINSIGDLKLSIETTIVKTLIYKNMVKDIVDEKVLITKRKLQQVKKIEYLNEINTQGFSTINTLTKYIEDKSYDYFPKLKYEANFNSIEKICSILEEEKRNKITMFFVVLTGVATIIFSYEAINKLFKMLDKQFETLLEQYTFGVWIILIIYVIVHLSYIFSNDKFKFK